MVTFCNTRVWSENLEKHFHSSKNLCSWRFCGAVFPWLMRCSWQAKDHVKQILHYMVHSTGSPLIGCPLIVLRFLKNVHSSHSTSMNFSIVLFWAMFLYFILIVRISHSTVFWCSTLTVLWGDFLYVWIKNFLNLAYGLWFLSGLTQLRQDFGWPNLEPKLQKLLF